MCVYNDIMWGLNKHFPLLFWGTACFFSPSCRDRRFNLPFPDRLPRSCCALQIRANLLSCDSAAQTLYIKCKCISVCTLWNDRIATCAYFPMIHQNPQCEWVSVRYCSHGRGIKERGRETGRRETHAWRAACVIELITGDNQHVKDGWFSVIALFCTL